MTTHIIDGVGKSIDVEGESGAYVVMRGAHNNGFFNHDGNSTFIISGTENSAFFRDVKDSNIFIHGTGNHFDTAELFNDSFNIKGTGNSLVLGCRGGYNEGQNTVTVSGVNNQIGMISGGWQGGPANNTIDDHGWGTKINIGNDGVNLSIRDFQHDGAGKVFVAEVTGAQLVSMEQSDGHGGTLINYAPNSSIDFINDAHVGISHFV